MSQNEDQSCCSCFSTLIKSVLIYLSILLMSSMIYFSIFYFMPQNEAKIEKIFCDSNNQVDENSYNIEYRSSFVSDLVMGIFFVYCITFIYVNVICLKKITSPQNDESRCRYVCQLLSAAKLTFLKLIIIAISVIDYFLILIYLLSFPKALPLPI